MEEEQGAGAERRNLSAAASVLELTPIAHTLHPTQLFPTVYSWIRAGQGSSVAPLVSVSGRDRDSGSDSGRGWVFPSNACSRLVVGTQERATGSQCRKRKSIYCCRLYPLMSLEPCTAT